MCLPVFLDTVSIATQQHCEGWDSIPSWSKKKLTLGQVREMAKGLPTSDSN